MLLVLQNWLQNLIVVILLISLVKVLLPSGQIKSYVRLILSLVVILLIIEPFAKIIKGSDYLLDSWVQKQSLFELTHAKQQTKVNAFDNKEEAINLYKSRLIEQLEFGLANLLGCEVHVLDVSINENIEQNSFGAIKQLKLAVAKEKITVQDESEPVLSDNALETKVISWLQTQYSAESNKIKIEINREG